MISNFSRFTVGTARMITIIIGLAGLVFFAGCHDGGGGTLVENPERMNILTFSNNDELVSYMK